MIILLKEGRKHIWMKDVTPLCPIKLVERNENVPLMEFILASNKKYRLFYDGKLEAIFIPTENAIHLAIFPNFISYYRMVL